MLTLLDRAGIGRNPADIGELSLHRLVKRVASVASVRRAMQRKEWSRFRAPYEWQHLRKCRNLSHSERTWSSLRSRHADDMQGEPGNELRSVRISRCLADSWGLDLPEFQQPGSS